MTSMRTNHRNGWQSTVRNAMVLKWRCIVSLVMMCLPVSCSYLTAPDIPRDIQAEKIVSEIVQGDSALTGFTCVAKIILAMPDQPMQFFRAAIAGRQTNRLRLDLLTPFGGSSASIASNGSYLYAYLHVSDEFYVRRIGKGDMSRFTGIDLTVGELLNFLMGRIPVDKTHIARMVQDTKMSHLQVELVDQRAIPRQRITMGKDNRPIQSQWLDDRGKPDRTLTFSKSRTIDGFVLPGTIQLTAASGMRITVIIQQYKPNAAVNDGIFTLYRGKKTNGR